jgi:hypothetical protein
MVPFLLPLTRRNVNHFALRAAGVAKVLEFQQSGIFPNGIYLPCKGFRRLYPRCRSDTRQFIFHSPFW